MTLILVLSIPPRNKPAFALCVTNTPLPAVVVENDELLSYACNLGWVPGGPSPEPCPRPATPVLYDTTKYPNLAQGVVLKTQVPTDMDLEYVTAVWWKMWKGPDPYWVYRQVDIGSPLPEPGDWVKFGAPELDNLTEHRFQVAFEDPDHHVTCWSDYSTIMTTTDFATTAPERPAGMSYVAEDHFDRPVTDFTRDTDADGKPDGDGLGPPVIWADLHYPDAKISDCDGDADGKGDCARVMQGTLTKYVKDEAPDEHSYSELLFTFDPEDPTDTDYNFEMEARYHDVGGVKKYYIAKVFNDNPYFTGSNLLIGRYDLQPQDYQADPASHVLSIPDDDQPKCNEEPFVSGDPVWFRIETEDDEFGNPAITSTLAWNCAAGDEILDCANVCTKTWIDTDISKQLTGIKGSWLFSVHHGDYFIDMFRAASESQP